MGVDLGGAVAAITLGLVANASVAQGSGSEIVGAYDGIAGHRSSMVISEIRSRLHITLSGGALSADTDSVAADCEAVAEGELIDGVLRATLIPFEGGGTSLDAKDIEKMDSRIIISFKGDIATVKGVFAHCGLRNALYGQYKKKQAQRIGVGSKE